MVWVYYADIGIRHPFGVGFDEGIVELTNIINHHGWFMQLHPGYNLGIFEQHNLFLQIFSEFGAIGYMFFIIFIILIAKKARKISINLYGLFVAFLSATLFLNAFSIFIFYFIIAFVLIEHNKEKSSLTQLAGEK